MKQNQINRELYNRLSNEAWEVVWQMTRGCGNNGCQVLKPIGMSTNAPCSCYPNKLAKRLREIADKLFPLV